MQSATPSSEQRLAAELYRSLHGGPEELVKAYRSVCAGAPTVLELGCGDGRVLDAIARLPHGPKCVGVERHPGMLALARQRLVDAASCEVVLIELDMVDLDLGLRFDRVLLPYSGLWCVAHAHQLEFLRRVRAHVAPEGLFLLDAYDGAELAPEPGAEAAQEPLIDDFEPVCELDHLGVHYVVHERNRHWYTERRMIADFEFRAPAPHPTERQQVEHHYLPLSDLVALLAQAGFSQIDPKPRATRAAVTATGQRFVACSP